MQDGTPEAAPEALNGPQNGAGQEPYTPKVILVTGGAGFIGSHVACHLAQKYPQYKVVALDKMDYCASQHGLAAVSGRPNFALVKGNILATDLLQYVLESEQVDTVLHFAAQTHVDASFGNSLSFTSNNTYGTHVLLEACREYGGVHRFVCVSTDEVYGTLPLGHAMSGLPEIGSLQPRNPYAAAKAAAELMAAAYHRSHGLPLIITRSNNVYGPSQFPEKLVPKFVLLAARGDRLPVHGSGESTRSYLYIDDVVDAFDRILHRGAVGKVYNIGSVQERSSLDVARDMCSLFHLSPAEHVEHVPDRRFTDRRHFICDPQLAALGWRERTPWDRGLRQTVDWYLAHAPDWWDPVAVEAALGVRHRLQ